MEIKFHSIEEINKLRENSVERTKTLLLLEAAINRRDPDVEYDVAERYFNGIGTEKDYEQAVYWYRHAAEQGSARAQYALGRCYYHGKGVEKSEAQARQWIQRAADQGLLDATAFLDFTLFGPIDESDDNYDDEEDYSVSPASTSVYVEESVPVYVEPPAPVREESIYYDYRTGERLYYGDNGTIVNAAGEEVAASWWD